MAFHLEHRSWFCGHGEVWRDDFDFPNVANKLFGLWSKLASLRLYNLIAACFPSPSYHPSGAVHAHHLFTGLLYNYVYALCAFLQVTFQTPIPTPKVAPVDPFAYEALRELDEKENWAERAEVIFKTEHEQLVDLSREILDDLIRSLPIG